MKTPGPGGTILAAPDKFRGTATAAGIAGAVAAACAATGRRCVEVPLADGGEGFLEVLGGANRTSVVSGPLGDPVTAGWRLQGGTAVVEMALASGMAALAGAPNDAVAASTYGTGELIAAAVDAGARRVLVGMGGSATTDGGFGALRALYPTQRLRGVRIEVACDVRTRFVDAASTFGPQKGASPAEVELLTRRLARLAEVYASDYGTEVADLEGSGAAGGLAGGLAAVGATLVGGFEVVADEVGLFEHLEEAALVVTGEGFVDAESFDGKVVGGVLELAAEVDVPALVVAGEVLDGGEVGRLAAASGGDVEVVSLVERFGAERARAEVLGCVTEVVAGVLGA